VKLLLAEGGEKKGIFTNKRECQGMAFIVELELGRFFWAEGGGVMWYIWGMEKIKPYFRHVKYFFSFAGTVKSQKDNEKYIYDFLELVIKLSSSILVLSFTAIQLGGNERNIDKNLVGLSWACFMLILILSSSLFYFRYIKGLSFDMLMSNVEKKKYKSNMDVTESDEFFNFRFFSRVQHWASLAILILFTAGFCVLLWAAYKIV
jgi:hypothetical protein